ncbi:MAG: hypothetical protein ACR5K9_10645 [Wolbachia sp.]
MAPKADNAWLSLVTKLIAQQFPKWAHLEIKPVELNGIDNKTFRLGKEMLIRLPSAEGYVLQALKTLTMD